MATTALRKENYKQTYFFGYRELNGEERVGLYDLDKDPEELNDFSRTKKEVRIELLHEMKANLARLSIVTKKGRNDQRVFYADIRSAMKDLDWQPKIDVEAGIRKLLEWVEESRGVF